MANFVASHGTIPPYGLISYTNGNLNLTDTTRATVVGTNFPAYDPQPFNNNVYGGTPTLASGTTFTPTSTSEGTQYFTVALPADGLYRVSFHVCVTTSHAGGTTTVTPYVTWNDGVTANSAAALFNQDGTTDANQLGAAGGSFARSRIIRVGASGGTRNIILYAVHSQTVAARTQGVAKAGFVVERIGD